MSTRLALFTCFFLVSATIFGQNYLFYLHNRFLEEFGLEDAHPEYGKAEYLEIIAAFESEGFTVLSEKRSKNTDMKNYARKITAQVDSLLKMGVPADHITILGTSKGGYIAQYVSTYLKNPEINFVFIGCYQDQDLKEMPEIQFCGNILSIYDQSDNFGVSAIRRVESSKLKVTRFREIELHTGLKHGFLYHPLPEWVFPASQWGKQNYRWEDYRKQVNDVLKKQAFNGVAMICKADEILLQNASGYSNIEKQVALQPGDLFRIGSISKQFTAVLVLRAWEKELLDLSAPIRKYLPELQQSWADSVTVHHLLTHTHGIREGGKNQPLEFSPGTRFSYSQTGYGLLATILEKVTGKSFAVLSRELFAECGMLHTFHPELLKEAVVDGYVEETQKLVPQQYGNTPLPVAAGGFMASASDLLRWNQSLHSGRLLQDSTYRKMITPQPHAIRQHPLFGQTLYGYGITIDPKNNQLGQTGRVDGFNSMDFYFPETGISLILLSNVQRTPDDPFQTFAVHMQLLEILRNSGLTKKLRIEIKHDMR